MLIPFDRGLLPGVLLRRYNLSGGYCLEVGRELVLPAQYRGFK